MLERVIIVCADHIDHLKLVAGIDHVGIGSDFDGIEMYVSFPSTEVKGVILGWSLLIILNANLYS